MAFKCGVFGADSLSNSTNDSGIATKHLMKGQFRVEPIAEVASQDAPADREEEIALPLLEATRRTSKYDASGCSVIRARSPYINDGVASPGRPSQYRQANERMPVDYVKHSGKKLRQQQLILLQAEVEILQRSSTEVRLSGVMQGWIQDGPRGTEERNGTEEIQEQDMLDEDGGQVSSTEDSANRYQGDSFHYPPFTIDPEGNRELPCKATAEAAGIMRNLNEEDINGASISLRPVTMSGQYHGCNLNLPQHPETHADLSKREPKKIKPTPVKNRALWPAPGKGKRKIRKMASKHWGKPTMSIYQQMQVPIREAPAATPQREDAIPSIHSPKTQLQASSKDIGRQTTLSNNDDGGKRLKGPSRETRTDGVHFSPMGTQKNPTRFSSTGTQTDLIHFSSIGTNTGQVLDKGHYEHAQVQMPFKDTQSPGHPVPLLDDNVPKKDGVASRPSAKKSSRHIQLQIDPTLKGPRLGEYLDVIIQPQMSMINRKASGTPKSPLKDLAKNEPKKSVEKNRAQPILPFHNGQESLRLVGSNGLRAHPRWRRLRKKPPTYPSIVGVSELQQTKYPFVTNQQSSAQHVVDTAGNIEEIRYPEIPPRRKRKTARKARVENQDHYPKRRIDSLFTTPLSGGPSDVKREREPETLDLQTNDLNRDLSESRHNTESSSDQFFVVELDKHQSSELDDGTIRSYWFPGPNDKRADGQLKAPRLKAQLKSRSIPVESVASRMHRKKVVGIIGKLPSSYRHPGSKIKPNPATPQKYRNFDQRPSHAVRYQKGSTLPSSPNGVPPPSSTTSQPTKKPHEHPSGKTPMPTPQTTNGAVPDDSDEGSDWDEEYPT